MSETLARAWPGPSGTGRCGSLDAATKAQQAHGAARGEDASARSKANITVRFTADEVSVTRDSAGEIIDGHPEKLTAMRDVWTFSRDTKSRDPRWLVIETRGDFEDDNKILPNTIQ